MPEGNAEMTSAVALLIEKKRKICRLSEVSQRHWSETNENRQELMYDFARFFCHRLGLSVALVFEASQASRIAECHYVFTHPGTLAAPVAGCSKSEYQQEKKIEIGNS